MTFKTTLAAAIQRSQLTVQGLPVKNVTYSNYGGLGKCVVLNLDNKQSFCTDSEQEITINEQGESNVMFNGSAKLVTFYKLKPLTANDMLDGFIHEEIYPDQIYLNTYRHYVTSKKIEYPIGFKFFKFKLARSDELWNSLPENPMCSISEKTWVVVVVANNQAEAEKLWVAANVMYSGCYCDLIQITDNTEIVPLTKELVSQS